jgi:hypothetical protein
MFGKGQLQELCMHLCECHDPAITQGGLQAADGVMCCLSNVVPVWIACSCSDGMRPWPPITAESGGLGMCVRTH